MRLDPPWLLPTQSLLGIKGSGRHAGRAVRFLASGWACCMTGPPCAIGIEAVQASGHDG